MINIECYQMTPREENSITSQLKSHNLFKKNITWRNQNSQKKKKL